MKKKSKIRKGKRESEGNEKRERNEEEKEMEVKNEEKIWDGENRAIQIKTRKRRR